MPKPITLEMLHEMSPDQRKTLHRNASGLDTDAAREVLTLLAQDGLMAAPKVPAKVSAKTAGTTKRAPAKKASAKKASAKKASTETKTAAAPIKAVYGRQA